MEGLPALAVTIACSVVLGIAVLLIIYKMIDGDLPMIPGIGGLCAILFLLGMCAKPVSDVIPGVILVVTLTCMVLFPFAAEELEKAALRALDTERLIKVYNTYVDRPDNISAVFEISQSLYKHGMRGHAIALATSAMNTLSERVDPVQNRSFRDTFRREEYMIKNWAREAEKDPKGNRPIACPKCGNVNPLGTLICEKCQRPYLLDIAHNMNIRPRIYGRLMIAFAALAGTIVLGASVGTMFSGAIQLIVILLTLAGVGGLIYWLFKPPKPG